MSLYAINEKNQALSSTSLLYILGVRVPRGMNEKRHTHEKMEKYTRDIESLNNNRSISANPTTIK